MTEAPPDSRPVPVDQLLATMHIEQTGTATDDALSHVVLRRTLLQDFTPLDGSLENRISDLAWSTAGVHAFAVDRVPHAVTSSGTLSHAAARMFFAHCLETTAEGALEVLELGAGTGLFARYFLDAFQSICRSEDRNFYDRLRYWVTDGSATMIRQWEAADQFAPHRNAVTPAICDATKPDTMRLADGTNHRVGGVRAIFCNYVLDALPATVVRKGREGIEELVIRTYLEPDAVSVAQNARLDVTDIARQLQAESPTDLDDLRALAPHFDLETSFGPCEGPPLRYADETLDSCAEPDYLLLNHGALACIEALLAALAPHGFLLVNDFGPTTPSRPDTQYTFQRFGATSAIGVNFPVLQRFAEARGVSVRIPRGDERRPLHSRLLHRDTPEGTLRAFDEALSTEAHERANAPIDSARIHLAAGRKNEALDEYRLALKRNPHDWLVVGEVAEFVGLHALDFAAGLELATRAVRINPWYSAWLWNVLGDCLFCLDRFDDAHHAYDQARRINPDDARTNLNLASSLAQLGRFPEALKLIAAGFMTDDDGLFRDRLLQKQQQILAAMTNRTAVVRERRTRRFDRLGRPGAPTDQ